MIVRAKGILAGLLLGALSLTGCQPSAAAGLSDADKAALRDQAQQTMKTVNTKDYAGWAKAFTDDAEWLASNAPAIRTRAAIQASVEKGAVMSELKLTQVDVDGRGDLAYVRGDYTINVTPPGATASIPDKGKYIEIWRKQADGSWKASKVIINSDIPLPAPPPVPAKKK